MVGTGLLRVPERFWLKVDKTDTCWLWTGSRNGDGYATFNLDGYYLAHRIVYAASVGPIPEGLTIDHLCRVRHCVNPGHLEAVTHAENVRRGEPATRTHCPQGHAYTAENTMTQQGRRHCRICRYARYRAWYARRKARAA